MYHYGGALRGLLWPHIIPINRSKASNSTATAPMERPSSSAGVVHQIETPNKDLRRRSSDGHRPRSPTSRPLSLLSSDIHSQVSGSSPTNPVMALPTFSVAEKEAILGPYAALPTPPKGSGDDIGLDFNPHLPPWTAASDGAVASVVDTTELPNLPETPLASPRVDIAHRRSPSPLVMAVDAASDGVDELSHLPDSPLGLAQFELGTRPSFDTSVRDLIQSRPDSPIGGQEAAPMATIKTKRSFNVGTLVTRGRLPPRIEISCADVEPCCEDDLNRPPKSRSRGSESQDMPGMENLPPCSVTQNQMSEYSTPMFTAPESPRVLRRTDGSDGSNDVDGPRLTVTDVRDFALTSDGSRSKKASKVPDCDLPITDPNDPDYCEDCVSPMTIPLVDPTLKMGKNSSTKRDGQVSSTEVAGKAGKAGKAVKVVPAGVLTDSTGELTAPGTPKPNKTNIIVAKGHVVIRKCRGVVLRTPVMMIVVGRQLAPSTCQALKVIAAGVPIETPKVPAAVPVKLPA